MSQNYKLPLADDFHSLQGEGLYTGTPMHFLRLAGCNVGTEHENIKPYHICRAWNGAKFICDTDYDKHLEVSIPEIIENTWEKHICLTGGEPLLHQHKLLEHGFFEEVMKADLTLHIETSGTIRIMEQICVKYGEYLWLTVSPKCGYIGHMLDYADEIKLLVDCNTSNKDFPKYLDQHSYVYLCPVNYIHSIDPRNFKHAMELLKTHPNWRLSVQVHKLVQIK